MSVTVKPLAASDRGAWEPLWHDYLTFYEQKLDASVTNETWRRLLDPDIDMHGICAVDDAGALTGIVHFLYHPVTWSIGPRCYLEDLFVASNARGTGVGRALIEAVYIHADSRGAGQVYWLTQHDNAEARRLYDRIARLTPFIKYQR